MLLINTDKEDTWKVYNVMDNKLLDLQLRVPNTRFCGSSKGWLIFMENDYAVTLVNPFFRVRGRREKQNSIIHLPPLLPPRETDKFYREHFDYYVYKAIISADPILNRKECIVVVVTQPFWQLAFIRLGKDSTWTYVDGRYRARGFDEVVFLEDKFYGVQSDSRVLSFKVNTHVHSNLKFAARRIETDYWYKNYLVYSIEKELLLVHRHFEDSRRTVKFVVYKLNFNNRKWTEINTIGDVALFVGDNSTFSVLASSFRGCLPNCIYFTHDSNSVKVHLGPDGPHDFGVYDVEYRRFLNVDTTQVSTLVKMSKQPPIWILPTFQL
ncbi:F-box protein At2g26160-like isoform X2 [Rosa rugosa]|nr:F-box protein At2g26160-like isoform X2 [Rosa rugosa]XP_061998035.1 F-box protein At2g26160-like isoform X2 [Rosa rugosa]XP_061998036.1 F-box protein At2g26160-like isoform X2 [Rosa rugosa]